MGKSHHISSPDPIMESAMNTRTTRSGARKLQRLQERGGRNNTDAGKLEDLPAEIRNTIYKMVLADSDVVRLKTYSPRDDVAFVVNGVKSIRVVRNQVAPVGHKRDSRHRGQELKMVGKGKEWVEIPVKHALLEVNKAVRAEAAPILYRTNVFELETIRALDYFLIQIGDENKSYLRNIELRSLPSAPWKPEDEVEIDVVPYQVRAMFRLASSPNLRTISINSLPEWGEDRDEESIARYVAACMPALKTLRRSYRANEIKADIFDVLRIKSATVNKTFHPDVGQCSAQSCAENCPQQHRRLARARETLKAEIKKGLKLDRILKD